LGIGAFEAIGAGLITIGAGGLIILNNPGQQPSTDSSLAPSFFPSKSREKGENGYTREAKAAAKMLEGQCAYLQSLIDDINKQLNGCKNKE
jgi:hypothetical protein